MYFVRIIVGTNRSRWLNDALGLTYQFSKAAVFDEIKGAREAIRAYGLRNSCDTSAFRVVEIPFRVVDDGA